VGVFESLRAAERRLCRELAPLRFGPPVAAVYNPLVYARRPHEGWLRRARAGVRVVYLGMNPGPFGMAQTGVPFGDVTHVRGWLGIEGPVGRPEAEHPKRPVRGFDCPRSEVSGERVWGALAAHYGTPDRFFRAAFIANYCPLVFVEASGRNRTPDKLPPREREALFAPCDRHLRRVVEVLRPRFVVGIGRFAEGRARAVLEEGAWRLGGILHPSPASPAANRGWAAAARRQLRALGACDGGEAGPAAGKAGRPRSRAR